MTCKFDFAHWLTRLRAPLSAALILVLASCNSTDSFTPNSSADPEAGDGLDGVPTEPSFSTAYAGGIPMGLFQTPYTSIGTRYNGTLRSIYPGNLVSELKAIKERGGKVVLNLAGSPRRFTDKAGNFSLSMWKASVDRYRNVNFSSYITDGTIVGNFLIDEPNDRHNWNGKPVSASTVEEMARYSKSRWSNLATVARTRPDYLLNSHRYLDAAWSQYLYRLGSASTFISHDVSVAKNKGLALIVGMNVLKGGNNGSKMTASQVKSWGGTLLANSYPCAFISWTYNSTYLSTTSMKDAMSYLRSRAQSRSFKNCRS